MTQTRHRTGPIRFDVRVTRADQIAPAVHQTVGTFLGHGDYDTEILGTEVALDGSSPGNPNFVALWRVTVEVTQR